MEPLLRGYGKTRELMLAPSAAAKKATRVRSCVKLKNAETAVRTYHGDPVKDRSWVLSMVTIQFGRYKGHCFRWLLENDVGWTSMIVASHMVRTIL